MARRNAAGRAGTAAGSLRGLGCALAVVLAMSLVALAAPALGSSVALFNNNTYVDYTGESPHGNEAANVEASLTALGHSVNTFSGITGSAIRSATAGKDALDIPEQENKCLSPDLTDDAADALRAFVGAGGELILHANDHDSPLVDCDALLLDNLFGFSVDPKASLASSTQQPGAAGTEFAGGPSTLPGNNATNGFDVTSLPSQAKVAYEDTVNGVSQVTVFRWGSGSVTDLGWDWFDSNPPDTGLTGQDGGWQSILDDAVRKPALSVAGVAVPEGNSGTSNANFVVSLSEPVSEQVSINYATADGTATSGVDYLGRAGTLLFGPGETSKTIAVPVVGDGLVEPSETFSLALSGAAGATIARPTATGTIVNDDATVVGGDTTAPGVALAGVPGSMKLSKLLKGVNASVTPSEASSIQGELDGSARQASVARAFNLVLATKRLGLASGKRNLKLKPNRKLLKHPAKKFTVRVRIVVTDASGNAKVVTKSIKVKR